MKTKLKEFLKRLFPFFFKQATETTPATPLPERATQPVTTTLTQLVAEKSPAVVAPTYELPPPAPQLGPQTGVLDAWNVKAIFGAGDNGFVLHHVAGECRLEFISDDYVEVGIVDNTNAYVGGFSGIVGSNYRFPVVQDKTPYRVFVKAVKQGTLWVSE